ncbi:hypothetical protein [Beijerinckia mobilis]|uniref:hypothetical protein n=1 Tax=Beijerinckia mobilis TaxID=231434 RepID=UPI0005572DE8|nr:hypothetical protein [Beijerinckia mobilis]
MASNRSMTNRGHFGFSAKPEKTPGSPFGTHSLQNSSFPKIQTGRRSKGEDFYPAAIARESLVARQRNLVSGRCGFFMKREVCGLVNPNLNSRANFPPEEDIHFRKGSGITFH